jgi:DNA-binding transcriptional LysR family regulator
VSVPQEPRKPAPLSTRKIMLTEAGQEYLVRCEQIARDLEKATGLYEPATRAVSERTESAGFPRAWRPLPTF